ncbi:MAG: potassium-transporting ATPase subunit KdpA, partial [Candidatus Dormibacteraeota bacterium]|nr:potassium-transporting ATPase subunit KdpA [Candidatus Dormibacteraeota bacterium]
MHRVFTGQRVFLSPAVRPLERGFYWLSGIKEDTEQSWVRYLVAMLLVQVVSLLISYVIFRVQNHLPLNPMGLGPVAPDLAMNTAISFTTNTNWQNYTGEQTMSYLSQMLGLATHNFLSAATGIALAVALVRAIASRTIRTIGNFYVDATRAILYLLLPISIVGGLILASQGAVQTLN